MTHDPSDGRPGRGEPVIEQQLGRRVVELVGVHRADDAHLVGDGVQVRHGVDIHMPALAVLRERPRRAQQLRHARGEGEPLPLEESIGAVLAVALDQFRLVVEQVQVRRRARTCAGR